LGFYGKNKNQTYTRAKLIMAGGMKMDMPMGSDINSVRGVGTGMGTGVGVVTEKGVDSDKERGAVKSYQLGTRKIKRCG